MILVPYTEIDARTRLLIETDDTFAYAHLFPRAANIAAKLGYLDRAGYPMDRCIRLVLSRWPYITIKRHSPDGNYTIDDETEA